MMSLYIVVIGIGMIVVFPIIFLVSFSFMSDYEFYSEWPKPIIPSFYCKFRISRLDQRVRFYIFNHAEDAFLPFGPGSLSPEQEDVRKIEYFIKKQANCTITAEKLHHYIESTLRNGEIYFAVTKNLLANYIVFFAVTHDSITSVLRSLVVSFLTIIISLIIGGLAGFSFARYFFRGKNLLKISVLFVRMFPAVTIAIPMGIILGNMGLADNPLGLALVYSVTLISLNIWITSSVFMSIPKSLEEAAMIFGSSGMGAFWRVTFPLALPGLTACAMYSFIESWNEVINAVILTQFNPTYPVVVYRSLLHAQGQINLITAGSVAQALPAVIFTLIIRKYILQMWSVMKF